VPPPIRLHPQRWGWPSAMISCLSRLGWRVGDHLAGRWPHSPGRTRRARIVVASGDGWRRTHRQSSGCVRPPNLGQSHVPEQRAPQRRWPKAGPVCRRAAKPALRHDESALCRPRCSSCWCSRPRRTTVVLRRQRSCSSGAHALQRKPRYPHEIQAEPRRCPAGRPRNQSRPKAIYIVSPDVLLPVCPSLILVLRPIQQ